MIFTAGSAISDLHDHASPERKKTNEWFFKTGKGEYGYGDQFIGVSMPDIRKIAKTHKTLPLAEVKKLMQHEIHEVRLCGLIILVSQYKAGSDGEKEVIVEFYLEHKQWINNWDLVDCSAHYVLGQAVLDGFVEQELLFDLAESEVLWDRRIAIVSTWIMIKGGNIDLTLKLSKKLLDDKEDLMHKAVGWMLRESWKVDPKSVEAFLIKYYPNIPRTALRYTIERIEEPQRKAFLRGEF